MMRKADLGAFLWPAFFLFFLFPVSIASAQSVDDGGASRSQQMANFAEAGKLIQTNSFTLEGGEVWVDTGISLEPGQRIAVTSEGSLRYADAKADNGPDGLTRGFKDLIRILPYNGGGRGAG